MNMSGKLVSHMHIKDNSSETGKDWTEKYFHVVWATKG